MFTERVEGPNTAAANLLLLNWILPYDGDPVPMLRPCDPASVSRLQASQVVMVRGCPDCHCEPQPQRN